MKALIWAAMLLVIAIVVGLEMKQDPGYVLIYFRHWIVEMPVWVGIIILLITIWLIHFIWRLGYSLFHRHGRVRNWYTIRDLHRSHQRLCEAWLAWMCGQWQQAEKLLMADKVKDAYPLSHYLAAARAAHEQAAPDRVNRYFAEAYACYPQQAMTIALAEAELALRLNQSSRALSLLHPFIDQAAKHPRLLKQLYGLYRDAQAWSNLLRLIPLLKKNRVLAPEAIESLEIACYGHQLLACQTDLPQLRRLWKRVPMGLTHRPLMVKGYVKALLSLHGDDEALVLVIHALRKGWDVELADWLVTIHTSDSEKQLAQVEGLLTLHGQRGEMLLVVAKLASRCHHWERAKVWVERAIERGVPQSAYTQLGFIYQQLGEATRACQYYQQGADLP